MENLLIKSINSYRTVIADSFQYSVQIKDYQQLESVSDYSWRLLAYLSKNNRLDPDVLAQFQLDYLFKKGEIKNSEELVYFIHHYPKLNKILQVFNQDVRSFPLWEKRRKELQYLTGVFIPIDIKDHILEHNTHQYRFHMEIAKQFQVELTVWTDHRLSTKEQQDILNQFAMAIHLVTKAYKISTKKGKGSLSPGPNPPPPLRIFYFATNFKKSLSSKEGYPDLDAYLEKLTRSCKLEGYRINPKKIHTGSSVRNINSALCNLAPKNRYITIWREEELVKVLMHELIHYFELEKVRLPNLAEMFDLNVSDTFDAHSIELITESQTWFLHLLFLQLNNRLDDAQLKQIIKREQQHALEKIGQFLAYNGITRWSHFWKNDENRYIVNCHCGLIYYYILKGLFISEMNRTVLDLIVPHRRFPITSEIIDHLEQQSSKSAAQINRYIQHYLKNQNDLSLKMTYFG